MSANIVIADSARRFNVFLMVKAFLFQVAVWSNSSRTGPIYLLYAVWIPGQFFPE
jgi:hypothetical protein